MNSNLPVPLSFVIKAITSGSEKWKTNLLELCKEHLTYNLKTKYFNEEELYFDKLNETDFNSDYLRFLFESIDDLNRIKIPAVIVEKKVLLEEDDTTDDPPYLFA